MGSSITSLVLDIAAEKSILAARAKLAPLDKFATSFAAAQNDVGASIKVPVFERGSASEFEAGSNDYTSASSAGVAGKTIELNKHPWKAQRLLPDDVMETAAGRDWLRQTSIACVESVAQYVADTVLVGAMKATGVQTLTISGDTATKKVAKMRKDAVAKGINPRNACLLLPTPLFTDLIEELKFNVIGDGTTREAIIARYLGWGAIEELQDEVSYTNESSKKVTLDAMIVAKDAIGVGTRLPLVQNPEKFDVSTLEVEELGPWSFQLRATGSAATDAKYLGAELIFGFEVLQPGKVMVASTTAA